MKKKIAIVGASYLQRPLVLKAREMGIETHVFAWREGNAVEDICDYYYPISILDKEAILAECRTIGIDGITSIASDLAMLAVNYVASELGLVGNSMEATMLSTDKYLMKEALKKAGLVDQNYLLVESSSEIVLENIQFPAIVKPTDRSGSRGVLKINSAGEVQSAVKNAMDVSISKRVIIEDFKVGKEFSVEFISFNGNHYPLTITEKVTTGFPNYVECEQHQPAQLRADLRNAVFDKVERCLNSLQLKNGASHTEIFILENGKIHIIECAGRMGGDFIGSDLVFLSTGFDFVRATIDVALGTFDFDTYRSSPRKPYSGVYYILTEPGRLLNILNNSKDYEDVVEAEALLKVGDHVLPIDSSDKRPGYIIYNSNQPKPLDDPSKVLKLQIA